MPPQLPVPVIQLPPEMYEIASKQERFPWQPNHTGFEPPSRPWEAGKWSARKISASLYLPPNPCRLEETRRGRGHPHQLRPGSNFRLQPTNFRFLWSNFPGILTLIFSFWHKCHKYLFTHKNFKYQEKDKFMCLHFNAGSMNNVGTTSH